MKAWKHLARSGSEGLWTNPPSLPALSARAALLCDAAAASARFLRTTPPRQPHLDGAWPLWCSRYQRRAAHGKDYGQTKLDSPFIQSIMPGSTNEIHGNATNSVSVTRSATTNQPTPRKIVVRLTRLPNALLVTYTFSPTGGVTKPSS